MDNGMENRIHLIMPMGGGGTRFGSLYEKPKPLIELQGKPFFYWAAQSVLRFVNVSSISFVVLREHVERYHIAEVIKSYYPYAEIRIIPHVLNGAVLTCMEGVQDIHDNLPILFNDCDHAFLCTDFNRFCTGGEFDMPDAALLTFSSDSPSYSYVCFDEHHAVTGTIEKQVASDEAICGAYYFRNKELFLKYAERYLKNCSYKEFFVSGIYNEIADAGLTIRTFRTEKHISFGTPAEYERVQNNSEIGELGL